MDTPPHLGGKDFEPFEPKDTCGALVRLRQRRRNGEVVSRVQRDGLIHDSEVLLELLELPAHPVETTQEGAVVDDLGVGIQQTLNSGLHDRCFARVSLLGRGLKPFGNLFGKLHSDFSLHRWSSVELNRVFAAVWDGRAIPRSIHQAIPRAGRSALSRAGVPASAGTIRSVLALLPGRRPAPFPGAVE